MKNELKIEKLSDVSAKNGRPYTYISIKFNNIELDRIFLRQTELSFFDSVIGSYYRKD